MLVALDQNRGFNTDQITEWERDEDGTLILVLSGTGFEPDSPHILPLTGVEAEIVHQYLRSQAVPLERLMTLVSSPF